MGQLEKKGSLPTMQQCDCHLKACEEKSAARKALEKKNVTILAVSEEGDSKGDFFPLHFFFNERNNYVYIYVRGNS